jgi:hypothetical protein
VGLAPPGQLSAGGPDHDAARAAEVLRVPNLVAGTYYQALPRQAAQRLSDAERMNTQQLGKLFCGVRTFSAQCFEKR